jgi:hypothetical protein
LPRLYRRNLFFLAALFVFQTLAFRLKPLSGFWRTAAGNGMPPFVAALMVFAVVLAVIQILTNLPCWKRRTWRVQENRLSTGVEWNSNWEQRRGGGPQLAIGFSTGDENQKPVTAFLAEREGFYYASLG